MCAIFCFGMLMPIGIEEARTKKKSHEFQSFSFSNEREGEKKNKTGKKAFVLIVLSPVAKTSKLRPWLSRFFFESMLCVFSFLVLSFSDLDSFALDSNQNMCQMHSLSLLLIHSPSYYEHESLVEWQMHTNTHNERPHKMNNICYAVQRAKSG